MLVCSNTYCFKEVIMHRKDKYYSDWANIHRSYILVELSVMLDKLDRCIAEVYQYWSSYKLKSRYTYSLCKDMLLRIDIILNKQSGEINKNFGTQLLNNKDKLNEISTFCCEVASKYNDPDSQKLENLKVNLFQVINELSNSDRSYGVSQKLFKPSSSEKLPKSHDEELLKEQLQKLNLTSL